MCCFSWIAPRGKYRLSMSMWRYCGKPLLKMVEGILEAGKCQRSGDTALLIS